MKKIPLRKCVVSNERYDKRELTRIVKNNQDEVFVDVTGKANGRGAYIYLSEANIKKAKDKKILDRVLETKIEDNIYEELERLLNEKKDS